MLAAWGILSTIAVAAYAVLGLAISIAVFRASRQDISLENEGAALPLPQVTVVVAARDEEATIGRCIDSLVAQDYPADRLTIVVVDDDSSDATASVLAWKTANVDNLQVIRPDSESSLVGKARALDAGIRVAGGTYIATTDADCTPPAGWLRGLVVEALRSGATMVCGCTVVAGSGLPAKIQRLDWANLLSSAAGLDALGKPLTAMGNNMLFKKGAYEELGGFAGLGPSVTEDFQFFQAITESGPSSVLVTPRHASMNVTLGEQSFTDLISQKKRWFAGAFGSPPWVWLIFTIFFAAHVGPAALFFFDIPAASKLSSIKIVVDATMILALAGSLHERMPWYLILLYHVYQTLSAIVLPVSTFLAPRVNWKERRHDLS